MGKNPAFQFYPGDWRRDTQVQMSSMETRGVWFEMLCCMWDAPSRGKLQGDRLEIARLLGCDLEIFDRTLNEINRLKIADVTNSHNEVTIINRRMYRDQKLRDNARIRKQRQRRSEISHNDVTLPSSPSPSSSPSSSSKKAKAGIEKLFDGDLKNADQNQISEIALPLINKKILEMAELLKAENIFPNVDKLIIHLYEKNKNPRTILHALIRTYLKREFSKSARAYCMKIISVEDGNYNERDHRKSKD